MPSGKRMQGTTLGANLCIVGTYGSGLVLLVCTLDGHYPSSGPEEAAEAHPDEVS